MSTSNKGRGVDPRLQNVANALYANGNDDITLRTEPSLTSVNGAPWFLQVARGLIPGVTYEQRSGYNPDISSGAPGESIWVEGGIYPYNAWNGTAQKLYVVSTSTSDTGQMIHIDGLDNNYNHITEIIVSAGTTAVSTVNNYIRIHTATIVSNNTPNVGEITVHVASGTGTVVAHIGAGLGITKLSQYTVPAGYTAYITYGDCTTFHGGSGNIGSLLKMMVRPYGGTFFCAFQAEVVNGYYRNDFTVPMNIPEKTDIDVQIIADANNTVATCNYQLILIAN